MAGQRRGETSETLYIYDRICPKSSKRLEILKEYGPDVKMLGSAPRTNTSRGNTETAGAARNYTNANASRPRRTSSASSPRGSGQAGARQRYAADATREIPTGNFSRNSSSQNRSNAGGYSRSGGYADAAVKERPFKIILESIISFIDTVEQRGLNDENIAKRRAVAAKKWSEYKNTIKMIAILLLVAALFVVCAYRLFFKINNIGIEGSTLYSDEAIVTASGISKGDLLYSFNSGDVARSITFRCPYIKSVDVELGIPNKVSFSITEDTAMYYACIWGDWMKLSSGLRVLEVTTEEEAKEAGLTKLSLPKIMYSVAGGVIEFDNPRDERFIRDALSVVENSQLSMSGKIDSIDLSNEYDITMEYDGKYLLEYGDEADLELKLLMGYKTITSDKFEAGVPARINLGTVGEASVKYDHSLITNSSK